MKDRDTLTELDILAYADGQLDHDPARKADVERRIAASSEASARVRLYTSQNAALRQAYGGRIASPAPYRLRAILDRADRPPPRPALQASAAVALALAAGLAGWMIGRADAPSDATVAALIDRSYANFGAATDVQPATTGTGTAGAVVRPLGWLADEVSLRIKAPDLSAAGFTLVDKQAVATEDGRSVRLDYVSAGDDAFSLFLAPRWGAGPDEPRQTEREGVTLTYWLDGPLATAVVTRMPGDRARQVAAAVRRAMRADRSAAPDPARQAEAGAMVIGATGPGDVEARPQRIGEPTELPPTTPN